MPTRPRLIAPLAVAPALALALAGCFKPNPYALADEDPSGGTDTSSDPVGDGPDDDPDDPKPDPGPPEGDPPGTGGPPDGDDGDPDEPEQPPPLDLGGDPSGDGDGDPSGDGDPDGPICELELERGPACVSCLAGACCLSASSCALDPDCACLLGCQLGGGSPGECKNSCDAKPEDSPLLATVLECAAQACGGAC